MWLTGHQGNFLPRLHQLPNNTGDLSNFIKEANIYIGLNAIEYNGFNLNMSGKAERECNMKTYQFSVDYSGAKLLSGYIFENKLIATTGGLGLYPFAVEINNLQSNNSYILNNSGFTNVYLNFTGNLNVVNFDANLIKEFVISGLNIQTLSATGNLIEKINLQYVQIQNSLILSNNNLGGLNVSNQTNLKQLIAPNNKMTSVNLATLTGITGLNLANNLLPSINLYEGLTPPTSINYNFINLSGNRLPTQQVDKVLIDNYLYNPRSGTLIDLRRNSAPSSSGLQARTILLASGWGSILVDP